MLRVGVWGGSRNTHSQAQYDQKLCDFPLQIESTVENQKIVSGNTVGNKVKTMYRYKVVCNHI